MRYSSVYVDAIGYELAPVVVTSSELEDQLGPVYTALRIPAGQLEAWTGIVERRWWEEGTPLWWGATRAARRALAAAGVAAGELGVLAYTGVCRDHFEPATACRVAAELGVGAETAVYDLSNACLGVLNGMLDVANRIALGQIRAGLVVSCESAREINELTIARLHDLRDMETVRECLATLTGGSGGVAVLLTDGSFGSQARALRGGTVRTAPQHYDLCRWGMEPLLPTDVKAHGISGLYRQYMTTDAINVLKYGTELGALTWRGLAGELGWGAETLASVKVICHQVGSAHRDTILRTLEIDPAREFSSFAYLGNMGTVALPLTAALAEERGFLMSGDTVAFLGIGSGLNCLMLGLDW